MDKNLSKIGQKLDNSSKLGSTQKIDKVNSEDSTIYILKLVSLRLVTLLKIYHVRYICNSAWILICVFVFVYFHMYLYFTHSGTLRSSYHYLLENIAHVMSICNFDQCCICVFVYLRICVFVYLYLCICKSDTKDHCFWGPLTITFSKI